LTVCGDNRRQSKSHVIMYDGYSVGPVVECDFLLL